MKRTIAHVPTFIPEAEDYKSMFPIMEELIKKADGVTSVERMNDIQVNVSLSVEELDTVINILKQIGFDYFVYNDNDECINEPYREDE